MVGVGATVRGMPMVQKRSIPQKVQALMFVTNRLCSWCSARRLHQMILNGGDPPVGLGRLRWIASALTAFWGVPPPSDFSRPARTLLAKAVVLVPMRMMAYVTAACKFHSWICTMEVA